MERSEELRSVLPFLPIMTMRYWSRIWPYLSCFLTLSHLFPSIKISFWKLFYFKTLKNKNTIRSTFIVLKNCFKKSIMSSITEPKWGNFFIFPSGAGDLVLKLPSLLETHYQKILIWILAEPLSQLHELRYIVCVRNLSSFCYILFHSPLQFYF